MTALADQATQVLSIVRDEQIAASIDIVFETVLEILGPLNERPDGTQLEMTIEPWPGGRWFRDLGNNTGHCWAHVQSIKPPSLIEFYGPLFMSAPVMSHVIYRLTAEGGGTRIKFSHRAVGDIPPELQDGVKTNQGWTFMLNRMRAAAEKKQGR